jgi:glycosyltransferase involved in cell wall biosynthesis
VFIDTPSIWTALVVGLLLLWVFLRTRLNYIAFAELKPSATSGLAKTDDLDVTVIIPARNEQKLVGDCVRSFPKSVRVIVVDDHSTDGTAKVARDAGAEVIDAPVLKRNTLGKPSALYAAASEHVKTRYMLFADADTRFAPEFLPALLGHANAHSLDMISLYLKRQNPNLLGALFMPYAYALYFAGIKVKDVHSLSLSHTSKALANGQCILFSASAYAFTGGHRTILNDVLDDIEIGRLAKRHRLKFQIMRAERLGRARMYESSLDFWRGFQKNSMRLLAYNRIAAFWSILTALAPFAYIPMLMWLRTDADEDYGTLAFYLFATVPFLPFVAWYKNPLVLLTPLISHLFPLLGINALGRFLLGIKDNWKGRKV